MQQETIDLLNQFNWENEKAIQDVLKEILKDECAGYADNLLGILQVGAGM